MFLAWGVLACQYTQYTDAVVNAGQYKQSGHRAAVAATVAIVGGYSLEKWPLMISRRA